MDLTKYVPPFGNLTVPPWVPFHSQVPGFRDQEYDINLPSITVDAASELLANELLVDADADYFIRELWFVVLPTTDGAVQPSDLRVKIRDGDGHLMTNDYCYANDLCGPLCPPWPVRAGAILLFDFQNQNADIDINVTVVLRAFKRMACANVSQPLPTLYVPMRKQYSQPANGEVYRDFAYPQRYDNYDVEPIPSTLLKFPIQMDNDADFILRGLTGQWATINNTEGTVGNVAITLYDSSNNSYNQNNLPEPWGGYYGEQRETILTNGGRIAPIYPEVRVPRGGVILVDIAFGTLTDLVRFALRGVKVYAEGACK